MRGLHRDRVMMVGYWVGDYVGFQRVPQICIDGIFSGAHTGTLSLWRKFSRRADSSAANTSAMGLVVWNCSPEGVSIIVRKDCDGASASLVYARHVCWTLFTCPGSEDFLHFLIWSLERLLYEFLLQFQLVQFLN